MRLDRFESHPVRFEPCSRLGYLSGYIVLLAILALAFILWRRGLPVPAIAALVVGVPLWFGWEYARPTWTTGLITGTEVRRSDPDAHGNTTDIEYIYMRTRSDRGFELVNEDSLVVVEAQQRARLQRRQDRAVSQHRNDSHVESVALHAFQLVSQRDRHRPIRLRPWWSLRTITFYGLSVVLWLSYFYAFFRLRRSSALLRDRDPDRE